MKTFLFAIACAFALALPSETAARTSGGTTARESSFDSTLSADSLMGWMKILSARPHHAGSPYGKQNAEFIADRFRAWGFETKIEQFDVLFPVPISRALEMLEPRKFSATLAEPPLGEDATSGQTPEQLPTYNVYSADGDVTAELVYVNYGVPDDYTELERRGIDVAGKIVIARYGGSWRGIKPKVAAEHGAIGCIIYSDPSGDGYAAGDVYPKGGYRSKAGAQRGSVADMPVYAGDPLTPSVASVHGAKRLALKDARTITKIPTLPVSSGDAAPLLEALGGPVVPGSWRGGLPFAYHFGPGPARVRLAVKFSWNNVPIYDVIGTIPGSERPDEWIIRGNHHDAWVNGATDPVSGLVAMMAEARSLGHLVRNGWRPKRSIVYCAWDGEEPGLLGSTEWVEANADALKQKAAVYINSDTNSKGFLNMGGSHSLQKFLNEVARDVPDPQYGVSVSERARAAGIVGSTGDGRDEIRNHRDLPLYPLGSGSDYTPFLQHAGIASLNVGFGGEDQYGQYHSIYDSYDHYVRFMDTDFSYGVTLAKTCGRAVMRLADAGVLPFEFSDFSETVSRYVKEVGELADRMRSEAEERQREIAEKSIVYASDTRLRFAEPKALDAVPYFNFAPLQNAVAALKEKASAYSARLDELAISGTSIPPDKQKVLDAVLMGMERRLTLDSGLPGRPWYTHQIYAPGAYTGYGVKTLPAVRESLELRRWKDVDPQIASVAGVLMNYAAGIDEALNILRSI
ncbi:MAG TPA: M28 family metallopeptidase [Bacteroidota bacterium]|nr:M28 family metallopeptidase [Bacteroidota bacterium]